MSAPAFPALQYPRIWPPPELAPHPPHRWSRVPIVGRVCAHYALLGRLRRHEEEVLEPLYREVLCQLASRPATGPWPAEVDQRRLAQIVAEAVRAEKGLPYPPALHPDDPFPLLFWGLTDDITPLIVRLECQAKLKLRIPDRLFNEAWDERWSIQHFIMQVVQEKSVPSRSAG